MIRLAGLLRRALSDPVSLSLRAWAAALPLVMIDSFSIDFLVLPDAQVHAAAAQAAMAAAGYAIGGLWLVLARPLLSVVRQPWLLALAAWGAVGATWGGVVAWWSRSDSTDPSAIESMGIGATLLATASMSVVFACFIAIVLHAHRQAQIASVAALDAAGRYRRASEQMSAVQMNARLGFRAWIDEVLQPTIDVLIREVEVRGARAAPRVDEVREQVVRAASRRLHPRTVALGPHVALGSVLEAYGFSDRLEVDISGEMPTEVTSCLARCLDVLLSKHRAGPVNVRLHHDRKHVHLQVAIAPDSLVAASPEVLARVENLDGTVEMADEGVDIRLPLIEDERVHVDQVQVVRSRDFDLYVWVAGALVPLTGIVLALLGGSIISIVLGALAVLLGALIVRLLPVWWISDRTDPVSIGVGVLSVALAAVGISTLVTLVWTATAADVSRTDGVIVFWWANAVVVGVVIVVVAFIRAQVRSWEERVGYAEQMSAAAMLRARTVIGEVDRFREDVASSLHSHVQARLIVAAGRLEDLRGADVDGAQRALLAIHDEDISHLRNLVDGRATSPQSLSALVGAFADVDVFMHLDEGLALEERGAVVEVVHEAIVNAVRHGGASQVRVEVTSDEADWLVCVTDDGSGPAHPVHSGLGLSLIDAASRGRWDLAGDDCAGAHLSARIRK